MHTYGIQKNGTDESIYLQGRNKVADMQNGLVDTVGEGEGGTN